MVGVDDGDYDALHVAGVRGREIGGVVSVQYRGIWRSGVVARAVQRPNNSSCRAI